MGKIAIIHTFFNFFIIALLLFLQALSPLPLICFVEMKSGNSWICHTCESQIVAIGSLEEKIATLTETKHEIQKKLVKLQPVILSPTRKRQRDPEHDRICPSAKQACPANVSVTII